VPLDANLDAMSVIAASPWRLDRTLARFQRQRQFRTSPLRGQSPQTDLPTANHRGSGSICEG
jgi:hypothetical protein